MPLNNSTDVDASNSTFSEVYNGGTQINGPQINYVGHPSSALDILSQTNVVGAAYDSLERDPAPKCEPNTRIAVLEELRKWLDRRDDRPICWLKGPAGSGKSAIAYTVAEEWDRNGKLAASFFFARGKHGRSEISHFFSTLAYQLAILVPQTKAGMQETLLREPHVFGQAYRHQFKKLIIDPLVKLKNGQLPKVVVIDSLDECDGDDAVEMLIRLLADTFQQPQLPLRIFLTSRTNHRLQGVFNDFTTKSKTYSLALEQFDAHDDIRTYFLSQFERLYTKHYIFMVHVPRPWPPRLDLEKLVEKSSGLFLFAATLISFVDDGRNSPQRKLQTALTTHAGLDPLYKQVLSAAPLESCFQRVIGTIMLLRTPLSIKELGCLLQIETVDILRALLGLQSILTIPEDDGEPIQLYHTSLQDFLTDSRRSERFFVDSRKHHAFIMFDCVKIMTQYLKNLSTINTLGSVAPLYACRYWCHHFNSALASEEQNHILGSESLNSMIQHLEDFESQSFDSWVYTLDGEMFNPRQDLTSVVSKLKVLPNCPKDLIRTLNNFQTRLPDNVVNGDHHYKIRNNTDMGHILASLRPIDRTGYYIMPCMEGTRVSVLEEIRHWLDDFNAPNVLWLSGCPGVGKSAIASTLVSMLEEQGRLGSSFFFKRGDITLSDPTGLWRTVAYDLALYDDAFAVGVADNLKEGLVDPSRPDIESHFEHMIRGPIARMEALQRVEDGQNRLTLLHPVIILDALDECGSDVSQRKIFFETIKRWPALPLAFKLVVTGRDEHFFTSFRSICKHIELPTGDAVTSDAANNLRFFFECRFAEISASYPSLPPEWPGVEIIDQLTRQAAGLFVWAVTVMQFIEEGFPDEQLNRLLSRDFGADNSLDRLYSQILYSKFHHVGDSIFTAFKAIIATLVLAKAPLRRQDLKFFLHVEVKETVIDFVLSRLSPIISMGIADRLIRIAHRSFAEFICDPRRCPRQFVIDGMMRSQALALMCLRVMNRDLKFNICGLETSYVRNEDVKDLTSRIERSIPHHLSYACQFWAAHIHDMTDKGIDDLALSQEMMSFIYDRLLYWLEVLSLIGRVPIASTSLLTAIRRFGRSNMKLQEFARDMSRFIVYFHIPIAESAPHIYLSALPFSPLESMASKHFLPQFPQTLSVTSGLTARWPACINVCSGHTETVLSVEFSPDGNHVVSGSDDGTIRIWDAKTGRKVAGPFEGHSNSVTSVAFSPNGKHVVSGSADKTIRIWDAETGDTVEGPLEGHFNAVSSVGFSPDGKQVVSGSADKTTCIWDAETGKSMAGPFNGHSSAVSSVRFSPDGRQMVSGSADKTIRVCDVKTGDIISGPFEGHTDIVTSVRFSPHGKWIVSGSSDKTIRIWDVRTGQTVAGPFEGHTDAVTSVTFSPDGKEVVSGSLDKTVRIWDAETGGIIAGPFDGHTDSVFSVAYSPDGEHVVSGSSDETIRIWDAQMIGTAPKEHDKMATDSDGWTYLGNGSVDNSGGSLLFWVPPLNRQDKRGTGTLPTDEDITRLNLSRFVHGSSWTQSRFHPYEEVSVSTPTPISSDDSHPPLTEQPPTIQPNQAGSSYGKNPPDFVPNESNDFHLRDILVILTPLIIAYCYVWQMGRK